MSTTANRNSDLPFLDWYLMPESYSAPLIDRAIKRNDLRPGDTIVDPFAGTGTSIVLAKLRGLHGLGVEVNPFLSFAGNVKCRFRYDTKVLRLEWDRLQGRTAVESEREDPIGGLFAVAGKIHGTSDGTLPARLAGERRPDMPRFDKWMSPKVAEKILLLSNGIQEIEDGPARDFFRLALAAILRPVGNMKLTAHAFGSVVIKEDAPVWRLFNSKVRKMIDDVEAFQASKKKVGRGKILNWDARRLDEVEDELLPAKLAITSPPYLNNLDYTMQTRLELFILGFVENMAGIQKIRREMMICDAKAVYREVTDGDYVKHFHTIQEIADSIEEKHRGKSWGWDYPFMVRQYFGGIFRVLKGMTAHLLPGAHFELVLGESAHSGVKVPVPTIIGELAVSLGYDLEAIEVHRKRRSSSHDFELEESSVILRRV